MKRKILYITGTRADYGLMKITLEKIHAHPSLSLELIVTGMHLMEDFGYSSREIENDGFTLTTVDATFEKDSRESYIRYMGKLLTSVSQIIPQINPDIILLLGDRAEMLAGAVAGTYLGIPVAHVHGGEHSSTVDDTARHAITKLSNFHFAATKRSAERIVRMGENPDHVFTTGAPGLDQVLSQRMISMNEIAKMYGIHPGRPLLMVIQHPVTSEIDSAALQIRETMEAVSASNEQTIVIYPNADPGGRKMIDVINGYKNHLNIKIFRNIPHTEFLSLLKISSVLIGNSSSGIIEAPSLKVPSINIGTRQDYRERAASVIDAGYDRNEILEKIRYAMYDESLKESVKNCINPYGDGHASARIVHLLHSLSLDAESVQKRMMY